MRITQADCIRQIRRLEMVFAQPKGKDDDEIAKGWMWVMGDDISPTELMAAVSEYAKTGGRYWPSASQIRELALQHRRNTGGHTQVTKPAVDPSMECPACGAKLRELTPAEQVLWLWDEEQGRRTQRLPESRAKRLGIHHDLSVSHAGLPVTYGSYRPEQQRREGAA